MATNLIDQHKNLNGIQVSDLQNVGEGVIETGNALTPGMVCTKGTAAGEVIPDNASGKHSGFVLENHKEGATTPRTAFVAGDRVRYGRDAKAKFMGLIASGQNLTKDTVLKTASGKLVAFVVGTDAPDKAIGRIKQEGGTGGALGADGHFLCEWGGV